MEMENEPQNKDVDLMSNTPKVTIQSPPPPATEPTSIEEGDVVPLDDDLVMDVYNMSFAEFQKMIIQARKKNFLDDHSSLEFVRERVIVEDTKKHPNSIIEAKLAFSGATISSIQYLMPKNEQLA